MQHTHSDDPRSLPDAGAIRDVVHPRGRLIVFGTLFGAGAMGGLAMIVVGATRFGDASEALRREGSFLLWSGVAVAGVFGFLAALLLSLRTRVYIDKESVLQDVSLLGRRHLKTLPIDDEGHVAVTRDVTSNGNHGSVTEWPVEYVHPLGRIEVRRFSSPQEGRRFAEQLANQLDTPLADGAYGESVRRERGTFDATIDDRRTSKVKGALVEAADQSIRISAYPFEDGIRVEIAPSGMGLSAWFGLLLVAGMIYTAVRVCSAHAAGQDGFPIAWVVICIVLTTMFAAIGGRLCWMALRYRESWALTRDGVSTLGRRASSRTYMSSSEIELVTLNTEQDAVLLVNDDRTLCVGHDLSSSDAGFLRDLVLRGLGVDESIE